jgi:pimeloyl-ACP methyl ester carboxylesterase
MIRVLLFLLVCPLVFGAEEKGPVVSPAIVARPEEQVLRALEPGRFKLLFQPFRTDSAALSPDGKYLAYSVREGEKLSVVVVEIDRPEKIKTRIQVIDDTAATPMLNANQREKTPGRINWMRWVTANRLAVETNRVLALPPEHEDEKWRQAKGEFVAFDADGSNARQLISPKHVMEFTRIIIPREGGENNFSIVRDNNPKFTSRVGLASEPPLEQFFGPPPEPPDPREVDLDRPPPEDDPRPVYNPDKSTSNPRDLRVFDLDPARPAAVTLLAKGTGRVTGSHQVSFYSLDVNTGKTVPLAQDFVRTNQDSRIDRQGRTRLTLPNAWPASLPLQYTYLGAKGQSRPSSLGQTAKLPGFSLSPENYFGERAIPLGFDENPNLLYYASNLGRDTYGVYSFDFATGKRGGLILENATYDLIGPPTEGFPDEKILVFDRFQHRLAGIRYEQAFRTTAWIQPERRALQAHLERIFAGRSVDIIEWARDEKRFLVATQGPTDPGGFFIYETETNKVKEFVRRAPWIEPNHLHVTLGFSYAAADGARISGRVVVPQRPRIKPIPMVVLCPDFPWRRVQSEFQADVHALADMGFVVVELNGRGAWGLGLKQRQSITAGFDLVQVEDIADAIVNLGKAFSVNTGRVAVMGRGHGGFIALRALQSHPDKFRCAVALDATVDVGEWLADRKWSGDELQPHLTKAWLGDAARLKAAPLTSHPEAITKPVLMLSYPGVDGAPRNTVYIAARNFAGDVKRRGATVEFDDLRTDYITGLPAARSEVFERIQEFLNAHVYDYKVDVREMEVVK